MFEASLIKCINCDVFYEPSKFFEKDIENMRKNHKLLNCKKCIELRYVKKNIINYYKLLYCKNL